MICPKCSREMGSDRSVCDYCGFTFQTPKQNDDAYTAPYSATPFTGSAFDRYAPTSSSAQTPGAFSPRPAVQTPPPPSYPPTYQPGYSAFSERSLNEPLSVAQYIGMFLLSCIPLAGLIVMIIWAAARSTNVNRRHFAGAVLILKGLSLLFVLGACAVFLVYNTPLFFYFYR